MDGRSLNGKVQITINKSDFEKLLEKAKEYGESIQTIVEWLVEEHIDEI